MIVICCTHIHACAHTCTQKERQSLLWPRYCSLQGPYPSLGNRCGTKRGEGGIGGGEQYERRTNGLVAPKVIVLLAPFSHYSTVCPYVCVCVYFRSCRADIILQSYTEIVYEVNLTICLTIGNTDHPTLCLAHQWSDWTAYYGHTHSWRWWSFRQWLLLMVKYFMSF